MTSSQAVQQASHVVVDTRDGYVFWRGNRDGALFTEQTATAFAAIRNSEPSEPSHPTYVVRRLVEPGSIVITAEQATMYAERGRKLTEIRKILAGFKIETRSEEDAEDAFRKILAGFKIETRSEEDAS